MLYLKGSIRDQARVAEQKNADYWEQKLGSAGIIVNRINSLQEVLEDENVFEGCMLRKADQVGVGEIYLPVLLLMDGREGSASQKGEHTDVVLAELNAGS